MTDGNLSTLSTLQPPSVAPVRSVDEAATWKSEPIVSGKCKRGVCVWLKESTQ